MPLTKKQVQSVVKDFGEEWVVRLLVYTSYRDVHFRLDDNTNPRKNGLERTLARIELLGIPFALLNRDEKGRYAIDKSRDYIAD